MLENFINSLSEEQKKELIKALSAGDTPSVDDTPPAEKKDQPRQSTRDISDFTSSIKKDDSKISRKPVSTSKRENLFVDDKTESVGEEFETPQVELAERSRPPVKKIEQNCVKCNKQFFVHPSHARDWFVCDRCIGAR
tara:strand:- start:15374 stop:15787 length:414 start_codon:yes stop_codon:yes gene_type:complete